MTAATVSLRSVVILLSLCFAAVLFVFLGSPGASPAKMLPDLPLLQVTDAVTEQPAPTTKFTPAPLTRAPRTTKASASSPSPRSSSSSSSSSSQVVWQPRDCGTFFEKNSTWFFGLLSKAGWDMQQRQRGGDVCAAWDTGDFVRVADPSAKRETGTGAAAAAAVQPWSRSQLPMAWRALGRRRLPPLKCSVGSCLASFIGSRVRKLSSSSFSSSSSPPWILFAGDSRTRHLLARLVSMIRSQFLPSENGDAVELRRVGVIEHYYHLNSTYTVFGRRRRRRKMKTDAEKDDDEFEIVSDRYHVLPIDRGCLDDPVHFGNTKNQNSHDDLIVIFRICLWWHVLSSELSGSSSSSSNNNNNNDAAGELMVRQLRPVAMTWMPTLHECMGRNRRDRVKGKYTRCLFDNRLMRGIASAWVKTVTTTATSANLDGGGGRRLFVRNFLALSLPNSLMAPAHVVAQRNYFVSLGLDDAADFMLKKENIKNASSSSSSSSSLSSSATSSGGGFLHLKQVNENENQNENNVDHEKRVAESTMELWFLDQAAWWQAVRPPMCDKTHSMCNLKPHRPLAARQVEFFCQLCRDEVGFVAVQEMLRILLA